MVFYRYATMGYEIAKHWGADSDRSQDARIKAATNDIELKWLMAAMVDSLVSAAQAQQQQDMAVADARLQCWGRPVPKQLAEPDEPDATERTLPTPIGEPISKEQWAEITPGIRSKLRRVGITHFSQLYDKGWTTVHGIGSASVHRVLVWRDRHKPPVAAT
jgi:hypothetical protein